MLPVECRGVSGSGCPGRVRCVWAAPGPTSPGSSGWLDNKAPPPDCWARQLEPGSACRDTLSCPWEGGGRGRDHGRPLAQHGEPWGGGEEATGMCGPRLRAPISPGDVGTETPGWRCGARWGGGGADGTWGHSCHTRPAQPAPPAGLSGMGTWHIGPGGCMGGTCGAAERRWCTEESGAVRWGQSRSRCPRVGSAVLVAGGARRRGGGRGRGCNPSNARYFPSAAARASPRLQRGWNAVSEPRHGGCNPPPSHRDVSEAPGGSRSFLPSFLFLAPLLGPCLCPCHIFHAMMGEEEEALNGVG